jgi:hypothetical protein
VVVKLNLRYLLFVLFFSQLLVVLSFYSFYPLWCSQELGCYISPEKLGSSSAVTIVTHKQQQTTVRKNKMDAPRVDCRSDTVTKPTKEMLVAMAGKNLVIVLFHGCNHSL